MDEYSNGIRFMKEILAGGELFALLETRKIGETLPLTESKPFIHSVEKKGFFWAGASPEVSCNFEVSHNSVFLESRFFFTNIADVFSLWYEEKKVLQLFPNYRYAFFKLEVSYPWKVLWDSQLERKNLSFVREAIKGGALFRIAMLDADDVWNIHPVSVATCNEHDEFELQTDFMEYPFVFRNPQNSQEFMSTHNVAFPSSFQDYGGEVLSAEKVHAWPSFYFLHSDGSYRNVFDLSRGTSQKYKRLVVFARR